MRRPTIAAIAAVSTIALSQIASAADLPRKAPLVPLPPPAYSWTGWYVGLNAGGAWGSWDTSADPNAIFNFPLTSAFITANQPNLNPGGFTGGGQIGYNWQTGNWVLGGEADLNYFGLRDSLAFGPNHVPGTTGNQLAVSRNVSTDWLETIRARLGFASNNWLFYVTGGLAVSELKFSDTVNVIIFPGIPGSFNASASSTQWGWTIGGGVEWGFSGRWTAKLEYLYLDLGDFDTTAPLVGPLVAAAALSGAATSFHTSLTSNIVRAGVNYRF
jgi:outer membrane immunogenic protein